MLVRVINPNKFGVGLIIARSVFEPIVTGAKLFCELDFGLLADERRYASEEFEITFSRLWEGIWVCSEVPDDREAIPRQLLQLSQA